MLTLPSDNPLDSIECNWHIQCGPERETSNLNRNMSNDFCFQSGYTSSSLHSPSLATMLVVIPHSPTKELATSPPPVCRLCSQEGSPDLFLFIVLLFQMSGPSTHPSESSNVNCTRITSQHLLAQASWVFIHRVLIVQAMCTSCWRAVLLTIFSWFSDSGVKVDYTQQWSSRCWQGRHPEK